MEQVPEMTGSETSSAERVRKHRKIKASNPKALRCNADETKRNTEKEIEIEKREDIEKEQELYKDSDLYSENTYREDGDRELSSSLEKRKKDDNDDILPSPNFNLELSKYYQENIGVLSGIQLQTLTSYVEDGMDVEVVKEAIRRASDYGITNFKYIQSILNNWFNKKILTMDQVDEDDIAFRKAKTPPEEVDPFDYN